MAGDMWLVSHGRCVTWQMCVLKHMPTLYAVSALSAISVLALLLLSHIELNLVVCCQVALL